jgi:hypothetical protein
MYIVLPPIHKKIHSYFPNLTVIHKLGSSNSNKLFLTEPTEPTVQCLKPPLLRVETDPVYGNIVFFRTPDSGQSKKTVILVSLGAVRQ